MCLKYRVKLGSKVWKNVRKTHILGNFRVMVHVVPCFSVSTRFRILAITYSFIIQFECFKLVVKIDFKENQTSSNRHLKILPLSGPEIHSKWGHVQAKFCFCFDHRTRNSLKVRVVSDVT